MTIGSVDYGRGGVVGRPTQNNNQGIMSLLSGLQAIKEAQKKRAEESLLADLVTARSQDELISKLGQYQDRQIQATPTNPFSQLFNAVNPWGSYRGTTDIERNIRSTMLGQILQDPLERQMKEAQLAVTRQATDPTAQLQREAQLKSAQWQTDPTAQRMREQELTSNQQGLKSQKLQTQQLRQQIEMTRQELANMPEQMSNENRAAKTRLKMLDEQLRAAQRANNQNQIFDPKELEKVNQELLILTEKVKQSQAMTRQMENPEIKSDEGNISEANKIAIDNLKKDYEEAKKYWTEDVSWREVLKAASEGKKKVVVPGWDWGNDVKVAPLLDRAKDIDARRKIYINALRKVGADMSLINEPETAAATTEGFAEPQTENEFRSILSELDRTDPEKAQKYFDTYIKRFRP